MNLIKLLINMFLIFYNYSGESPKESSDNEGLLQELRASSFTLTENHKSLR